jgi:aspartyl-tRNA(Asn)/glutamyl-tRNA(Gln) amidotransferase subunit A
MGAIVELADLSAAELAKAYRQGTASPVEATEAALRRIDALNESYNAFCLVDCAAALASARQSEQRWLNGEPLSAIDGVPATIKDLLLTRGWPTLRGSRTIDPQQDWAEDAPATARLREAGAVLLGKTTTPEFGWKGVTDSPLTGITRNPWDATKTPGGSSGGAAVAAALGMGCLHVGTDGGGSIRIPAGFAGIIGLKPTFGLVPAYPPSPFAAVAHIGPMTRTVADAALMLNVIAQPDWRDWQSLPYMVRDHAAGLDGGVRGVRMALSLDLGYARVDPEVAAVVRKAAGALAELGAIVEERDPGFADPQETFVAHWLSGAASLRSKIKPQLRPLLDPGLNEAADAGEAIPHMDYIAALEARAALGLHMARFHQTWDVLLTPTLPIPAFEAGCLAPPGDEMSDWAHWTPFTFPFNLTQQPAASIPCGLTGAGLPVGLQIVAAKYRDDLVLQVARAFEAAHPITLPTPAGASAYAR